MFWLIITADNIPSQSSIVGVGVGATNSKSANLSSHTASLFPFSAVMLGISDVGKALCGDDDSGRRYM